MTNRAKGTSKKGKSKGRGSSKRSGSSKTGGGWLSAEQQQDVFAVGLIALALLTALALLPVSVFGPVASDLFPSGNVIGVVGSGLRTALNAVFGFGSALVPPLLFVSGLLVGGWGPRHWVARSGLFGVGLLALVPIGLEVLWSARGTGGWWGATVGGGLTALVGWVGALILLGALGVVLCVTTVRWNPLRTLATGVASGSEAIRQGALSVSEELKARRERLAQESQAVTIVEDEPFDGFAPEDPDHEDRKDSEDIVSGDGLYAPTVELEPPELERGPVISHAVASDEGFSELPSPDLLELREAVGRAGMESELERLGEVLVERLRTFNVESRLGGRTTGPVVTQYEVVPAAGVKVNRIANLDADLALAMKAPSVRIVAPIPGKGAVGVEIPNPQAEIVQLREIIESREFERAKGVLPLGLGKDLTGRPYVADLAKMPHLLIAGATGAGKSVCINTIITSLVYKHTPETLRLLMVDPKMVELSTYADLPHLRHPVVTDPEEAAGVLKWAVLEMERRYQLLSANGVRSIAEFNARVHEGVILRRPTPRDGDESEGDEDRFIYGDGILPYIVLVVDELADLMMQVQSEVEKPLAQLAQKARAIGIHLIVATQRPSVNVITGLIKANFPTRIGFRVASKTDSRTILDQNGAESLLGNGDMLFLPPGQSASVRIQGAYISTADTDQLIGWYRERRAEIEAADALAGRDREVDILAEVRASEQLDATEIAEEIKGDWDELFRAAAEVCISNQQGSTSLLQRKLRIGYGRAARIVDQLYDAGVVGAPDGSKPREVLITLGELDEICGPAR